MEWHPIETAPRDGTMVRLAFMGEKGLEITATMQWGHIQKNAYFGGGTVGMWVSRIGDFTWADHFNDGPTHWMPFETIAEDWDA